MDYNFPGQYIDSLTMLPAVDYNCGDSLVELNFVVKLDCESIAQDGSDFRFTFVGDFKIDEFKGLIEKYLGSLPNTGRKEKYKDD